MKQFVRFCAALALLIASVNRPSHSQTAPSKPPHEFDLLNASISDIQAAVSAGALSYEHLVQLYLNRIQAYDKNGPKLNAVIEINSTRSRSSALAGRRTQSQGPA